MPFTISFTRISLSKISFVTVICLILLYTCFTGLQKVYAQTVSVSSEVQRNLEIVINPEKRLPSLGNDSDNVQFTFLNASNQVVYSYSGTSNKYGKVTFPVISPTSLPEGVYTIKVKELSHLTRKFIGVVISDKQFFTLNLTSKDLLGGDIHPSNDDYVNGLDITYLTMNLYGNDLRSDQNRDGIVNSLDYSITLDNFYKSGE